MCSSVRVTLCAIVLRSPATLATLNTPVGIFVNGSNGGMFISDFGNNVIRFVAPNGTSITTYAGNGSSFYFGNGISASKAV